MVQVREPLVDDIIGFVYGVSFPAECTDDCIVQKGMFCGFDCDMMVNNVFAYGELGRWAFDGVILESDEEEDAFI